MANIRDLNRKIHSLRNMQKVMGAMNMIASIKLRKLLKSQNAIVSFSNNLDMIKENLLKVVNNTDNTDNPLIDSKKKRKNIHIIFFSADKGLCGSHNNSVRKSVEYIMDKYKKDQINFDFSCIGTKGASYCKHNQLSIIIQKEIHERSLTLDDLEIISENIFERFMKNEIQEVIVVYNKFESTIQQKSIINHILPFKHEEKNNEKPQFNYSGYIEPQEDIFIPQAARLYLFYMLQLALFNSRLSEQAARMTAMENATNNSEDLINRYGRARNRVRQASITNELIEIISGKEAMKR